MTPQQMLDRAARSLDERMSFIRIANAAAWTFLAIATRYIQGEES